jgi:hypothetical protein
VENEGEATHLFVTDGTNEEDYKEERATKLEAWLKILTEVLHDSGNQQARDIALLCLLGFIVVDDDNEPAPEITPLPQENNKNAGTYGRAWGIDWNFP